MMLKFSQILIGVFLPAWLVACGNDSASSFVPPQPCPIGGCPSELQVHNPTGSCLAPDSGVRVGYHYPLDSQWIPDCQNPLSREYWRVFVTSEGEVYTSPRIDAEINSPFQSPFQPICQDPNHELAPIVEDYRLCAPMVSATDLALLPQMSLSEALTLTHFLHQQLRFEVRTVDLSEVDSFETLTPWPIPSDIVAACELDPDLNSPELSQRCEQEKTRLQRIEEGYPADLAGRRYEGPVGIELAHRLNQLYGITPD